MDDASPLMFRRSSTLFTLFWPSVMGEERNESGIRTTDEIIADNCEYRPARRGVVEKQKKTIGRHRQ